VSEHSELFEISELSVISFECPACKTEVLFRLDTPTTFGAPYVCPTCRETFPEIGNFLARYRELYGLAKGIGERMKLRLRVTTAGE